jgi:hypothetical protein
MSVKTQAQLRAEYTDNTSGAITAGDGRDLIDTSFGYIGTTDPGANNDGSDSAGIGAAFSPGTRWLNTATPSAWVCVSAAAHSAVWVRTDRAPAPQPGLLAVCQYSTPANSAITTSSTTPTAVDVGNLYLTFYAPPTGRVLLRASCTGYIASPGQGLFGFGDAVANRALGVMVALGDQSAASRAWILAGLTPGASYTYYMNWMTVDGTPLSIYLGPAYGPVVLEAWAA